METDTLDTIEIRKIHKSEFAEAVQLIHQSISTLTAKDYTNQQIQRIIKPYTVEFLKQSKIIWVAKIQSNLIGIAILSITKYLPIGNIQGVFVHPDYARQGIGTKLMTQLEEYAIQKNLAVIGVISSLTAIQFYKSLSYQLGHKIVILEDVSCRRMHKHLRKLGMKDWIVWLTLIVAYLLIALIAVAIFSILGI